MNILPLVLSFLIILGIIVSTLSHGHLAIILEKRNIKGYLNAKQALWNIQQAKLYRKAPGKKKVIPADPKKISNEEEEEERTETNNYFREKRCYHESGKFNLHPLLHDPYSPGAKQLYEPAAQLIRLLYQNTSLWREKEDLEYQILDGLIKNKETSFYDTFSENSILGSIFYKMLKGSNTYKVETSEGIPPFFDFFRHDNALKDKIDFRYAPKIVLKAIFEDEVWKKIELEEKKENKHLTKEKLNILLDAFPQKKSQLQDFNLFIFSGNGEAESAVTDKTTGITVKR